MKSTETYDEIIAFIRNEFQTETEFIPLHEPIFIGNEREYVMDAIDSTFVSSIGAYVDKFEEMVAEMTGVNHAVAVVNGTSALHIALLMVGVEDGDEVITQPLSFVATANAISYTGAKPVFVDVDKETLGLSPDKLDEYLQKILTYQNGAWLNKHTCKKVAACVPMHTFGLPNKIDEIVKVCDNYDIPVLEDAAESLGSTFQGKHTGTFGELGIFSFNGNKTVTCGGGGAIVTDNKEFALKAKHVTTMAKKSHKWEYVHDQIGYNYRMPNLNAAMACAQLEMLEKFIQKKRTLAESYSTFFGDKRIAFVSESAECRSNYWLNAIRLQNRQERDRFLAYTNERNVMTRPVWRLLNKLSMFSDCQTGNLDNAEWLEDRIVNIPSSPKI